MLTWKIWRHNIEAWTVSAMESLLDLWCSAGQRSRMKDRTCLRDQKRFIREIVFIYIWCFISFEQRLTFDSWCRWSRKDTPFMHEGPDESKVNQQSFPLRSLKQVQTTSKHRTCRWDLIFKSILKSSRMNAKEHSIRKSSGRVINRPDSLKETLELSGLDACESFIY